MAATEIHLEVVVTKYSGQCYKITEKTSGNLGGSNTTRTIGVTFNESISSNNLPLLTMYLTSEGNAYGITMLKWFEGDVMEIYLAEKMYKRIIIRPRQKISLEKKKDYCSNVTVYDCMQSKFLKQSTSY